MKLALRPSWLTAVPWRHTAPDTPPDTSRAAPHASDRPKPSAFASNVLHCPSGERAFNELRPIQLAACNCRFTPATSACSHLCNARLVYPESRATKEDEHAVLTLQHGPFSPNRYDARPAAELLSDPCAENTELATLWSRCTCAQLESLQKPRNTAAAEPRIALLLYPACIHVLKTASSSTR